MTLQGRVMRSREEATGGTAGKFKRVCTSPEILRNRSCIFLKSGHILKRTTSNFGSTELPSVCRRVNKSPGKTGFSPRSPKSSLRAYGLSLKICTKVFLMKCATRNARELQSWRSRWDNSFLGGEKPGALGSPPLPIVTQCHGRPSVCGELLCWNPPRHVSPLSPIPNP